MAGYPDFIDDVRRRRGLMTVEDLGRLVTRGNVVFDPFSVLIAAHAEIGSGNVFFPSVSILGEAGVPLTIGDDNVFHTGCLFEIVAGPLVVGSSNQFGEGGFTAKTNRPGAAIEIGDGGRYLNGAAILGRSLLGSGSQVLGAISVDDCRLEAGGTWREPDPDLRAGLLKGSGTARGLVVPCGKVIAGQGVFAAADMVDQTTFHPKPRTG